MALVPTLALGTTTAPTQSPLDSSTKLATTDYVDDAVTAGGGGGGGGGAEVLITESVAGVGGVASFSFTSIAATWRDLRVVLRGRGEKAAVLTTITMQLNNDSSAIYDSQRLELVNTSIAQSSGLVTQTSWHIGYLPAANAVAGCASTAETRIYDYRGTTFHKHASTHNGVKFSTGVPGVSDVALDRFEHWYRSTSAITRVDLFCDSGDFAEGSIASLYGIL